MTLIFFSLIYSPELLLCISHTHIGASINNIISPAKSPPALSATNLVTPRCAPHPKTLKIQTKNNTSMTLIFFSLIYSPELLLCIYITHTHRRIDQQYYFPGKIWVENFFFSTTPGSSFSRNVDFRPYFSSALRGNGFVQNSTFYEGG